MSQVFPRFVIDGSLQAGRMTLRIHNVQFYCLPMRTRFPFRYGIAALTALPHVIVQVDAEVHGKRVAGYSADGLAPKWFTKNAETSFEDDDLPEMLRVIRRAADHAMEAGRCSTFFELWKNVYDAQVAWAVDESVPPLLAGLGVSLIERALLDAFCRAKRATLHSVIMENGLGISFSTLRKSLADVTPKDVVPFQPRSSVVVRHTIGLGDPLTAADAEGMPRPDDGLPFTLEENIDRYGLTHFKLKLSGDFDTDHERLVLITELLRKNVGPAARFTFDANEQFRSLSHFRDHWQRHMEADSLRTFFETGLIFVEQPLHRDCALSDSVRSELMDWPDAPPLIIDESDAEFGSFPRALELGYSGTSHKNCKGIIKGLTNAATVGALRRSGQQAILSAEDLGNVGPLALAQDLAVVACLDIDHVERNGHHYFAGLTQFPPPEQDRVAAVFGDLYGGSEFKFPSLKIADGSLTLRDVNRAAFGHDSHIDVQLFESLPG